MWFYVAVTCAGLFLTTTLYYASQYVSEKKENERLRQENKGLKENNAKHKSHEKVTLGKINNLNALNEQLKRNQQNLRQRLGRAEAARQPTNQVNQGVRQENVEDESDMSDNEMPSP